MMTHKEAVAAIRALGLAVTCEYGEYRITFRATDMHDPSAREEHAYYTTDRDDALGTAKRLRHWFVTRNEQEL